MNYLQPKRDPKIVCIKGRYYLRFYDSVRGRKAVSLHTSTKRSALAKAAPITEAYAKALYDPFSEASGPQPLEQVVASFLSSKRGLRPSSYRSIEGTIQPFLDNVGLYAGFEETQQWVYGRRDGTGVASSRTIERRLTTLHMLAHRLVSEGLPSPTVLRVKSPPVYSDPVRFLTRDEARRVIEAARMRRWWMLPLVLLGLGTGGRISSLLRLTANDIQNGMVYFDRAKRGGYTVPVFPFTEEALALLRPSGLLFGREYNMEYCTRRFSVLRDDLSLPKAYSFHVLRHTFASWLVQEGVSLYQVSQWMGHKDLSTTQRYAHLGLCHMTAKTRNILSL